MYLQPENVVCTHKDNTSVKIIDFGTAKELEPSEQVSYKPIINIATIYINQVKSLCGTAEFVAPEIVNYDFISTGTGKGCP